MQVTFQYLVCVTSHLCFTVSPLRRRLQTLRVNCRVISRTTSTSSSTAVVGARAPSWPPDLGILAQVFLYLFLITSPSLTVAYTDVTIYVFYHIIFILDFALVSHQVA